MARGRPVIDPGTYGEIGLTPLPNGKVQANVQVRLSNGTYKRLRRVGTSTADATRKIKRAAAEATTTTDTDTLRTTSTVRELVAEWLETHEASPRSIEVYKSTAVNHIYPALGSLRLNEVRTSTVESFVRTLADRPATAKRARSVLSSAFAMAVRYDLVTVNPVRETTAPKVERKDVRVFEGREMPAFFAMVDNYVQGKKPGPAVRALPFPNLVRFLAGTGVRLSEALAFRKEDIDLTTTPPTATVRPTKDGGESTRVVQLPTIAVDAVKRQIAATHDFSEWLFPTSRGTHVSKSTAERWIRSAREDWKDSEKAKDWPAVDWVTFHTFRRNVATLLADRVSVQAATQQLGHADSVVTEHHYLARPKAGPAVADVLNEHLHGAESGKKLAK